MSRNLTSTELKRLHRTERRATQRRMALLTDGVSNPYNLGSILRTAAAFNCDHLWLVGAPSPNDAKVNKTALGSQKFLTWTHCDSTAEAFSLASAAGYSLVGVELTETAVPLSTIEWADDCCLVLGHEDRGLSSEALQSLTTIGYIPQLGKIGSLNVAMAAGMAMYEFRRHTNVTD